MEIITERDIEEALLKLDELNSDPIDHLFNEMDKEQSIILDYLYEAEGDDLNDIERGIMIDTTVIGWYIIKQTIGIDKKINDERIDLFLEKNIEHFELDEDDKDETEEDIIQFFSEFNDQPFLMLYLNNLILGQPKEGSVHIRENVILTIILHIKTVVDCLVFKD